MSTGPQRAECVHRLRGWLVPALLLVFAPKCVLCLLGYAGVGIALGLGGPEICGEAAAAPWTWLPALGVAAGAVVVFARGISRRA